MQQYTERDVQILDDLLAIIRGNPAMYVGVAAPTGEHLAHHMISGLIWLDALPAKVSRADSWWVLSSEKDWLANDSDLGVFSRTVPFPASGPNGFRPEILLAAFADAVVTSGKGDVKWIKGDQNRFGLPSEFKSADGICGRTVAFLLR